MQDDDVQKILETYVGSDISETSFIIDDISNDVRTKLGYELDRTQQETILHWLISGASEEDIPDLHAF